MLGTKRFKQVRQAVVIDFLHQGQQATQFAMGKTLAGEPVQVGARQVGNDSTLVFAEGHLPGDQQFEFFRVHRRVVFSQSWENTGILHAGQLTDHAKKTDTDFLIKRK
jgi:hypothetical protein